MKLGHSSGGYFRIESFFPLQLGEKGIDSICSLAVGFHPDEDGAGSGPCCRSMAIGLAHPRHISPAALEESAPSLLQLLALLTCRFDGDCSWPRNESRRSFGF